MKNVGVDVYPFRFWRVELKDGFFVLEEQALDPTHFQPVRDAPTGGDANMFPTFSFGKLAGGRDDAEGLTKRPC
jgi:hypothetical protein